MASNPCNSLMSKAPDPLPASTREYIASSYVARTYDYFFRDNQLFNFDTDLLDEVLPRGSRVLDLGCGTGRHTLHLSNKGSFVLGVDLSHHMLATCSRKLRSSGRKSFLVRANICELGFIRDAGFDAAICMFSTIGLIRGKHNREQFARGVRRALRKPGLFVLHTHNFYHSFLDPVEKLWPLKSALNSLMGKSEIGDKNLSYYRGVQNMYIHVFRDAEVKRLLEKCGFLVRRIIYLNEARNAELPPSLFNRLRANGFIFVAEAV